MADTMDDALQILHRTGPEFGSGLTNHGPMAAEALVAMKRPHAVIPWVESYKSRLQDSPKPYHPITRDNWREALGEGTRVGDWVAFFDRELAQASWGEVLRVWVPRLSPGLMAAATHGLIRTAHAVRSLAGAETPQRVHELAQGLGYWAACYWLLPGKPSVHDAGRWPRKALERVGRVHSPDFEAQGRIGQQVRGLAEHPAFTEVINLVDTGGDLSGFISDLTETFAGLYLANRKNLIAFVHTVTAPSALRMVAPYLSDTDSRLAARYAWQACAAIYAWYSAGPPPATSDLAPPPDDTDGLIDRAIAAGGAHTIKFTEACLREYALNPKPVYLAAARDVAERIGPV